jgi:hypothetical protein
MFKYFLYSINFIFLFAIGIRALLGNFFSNTFEIEKLVFTLLLSGLVVALLYGRYYAKKKNITDHIELAQTVLTLVFLISFAFVALGVNLNYMFSQNPNQIQTVTITHIEPFIKIRGGIVKGEKIEPSGYHVFIEKNGTTARVRYAEFPDYKKFIGQQVTLNIRRGLLGFEVFIPKALSN